MKVSGFPEGEIDNAEWQTDEGDSAEEPQCHTDGAGPLCIIDLDVDAGRVNFNSDLTVSFPQRRAESMGFEKICHVLPSPRAPPKSARLQVQFVNASNLEETKCTTVLTPLQEYCTQSVKQV